MPINFPDNPTDNQEFNGYIYDATRGVWDVKLASDPLGSINLTTPAQGEVLSFDGTNWVNQEIVTNPYSSATDATDFFAIPKGTDEQRPVTPQDGYIRFNSTSGEPEWYSADLDTWFSFRSLPTLDISFELQYLVVAGGGGGGNGYGGYKEGGGGGGAGGYRISYAGESSGGGGSSESVIPITTGTSSATLGVTVGAGGAKSIDTPGNFGFNGSNSVLSSITSVGGGGGAPHDTAGKLGGSGGGGGADGTDNNGAVGGLGTVNQGYAGGAGYVGSAAGAGGGGGASGVGSNGTSAASGGAGGPGLTTQISASSLSIAGGGGGGGYTGSGAGANGGGNGCIRSTSVPATSASPGTGSGGGGGSQEFSPAGNGGSGIVILRYPDTVSITHGVGLVSSTSTVGTEKVTTFTAGSGSVTFEMA